MLRKFVAGSFLFGAIAVVSILLMSGCDVNPSKITSDYAKELAGKITYTKDVRTGLCFAVIASRKTGSTDQTGMGMTEVPCSKEVEALVK